MLQVLSSELKAKLSYHLRLVRENRVVITVLDRKTPIARLVPVETDLPRLDMREPKQPWVALDALAPSGLSIESTEKTLLAERRDRW